MADENFGIVVEINPRPALAGSGEVDRALAKNENSARDFERAAKQAMAEVEKAARAAATAQEKAAKDAARAATAATRQAAKEQEETARAMTIAAERRAKERAQVEIEASRKAAAAQRQAADQQKQAQAGLAAAYKQIVGPAAEYQQRLAQIIQLERQGAISAKQRAQAIAGMQREMSQFNAQQQGGVRGAVSGALSSQFGGAALAAGAVGAAAAAAKATVDLGDQYIALSNKIRQSTTSEEEMIRVRERLFKSADRARVDVQLLTGVYGQMRIATKDLGTSQGELLRVSELLAKATRGVTEANKSAGLQQFGQALTKGKLQAEELMSIMENIPKVGVLLAQGMGMTVGELRKAAEEGKVGTQEMLDAIQRVGPQIEAEFGKSAATSAESWTALKNQVLQTVGGFAAQVDVAGNVSRVVSEIGSGLRIVGTLVSQQVGLWKSVDGATGGILGKIAKQPGILGQIEGLVSRTATQNLFGAEYIERQTEALLKQIAVIEKRTASLLETRLEFEQNAFSTKGISLDADGQATGYGILGNFTRNSALAAERNKDRKDEKAAKSFFGLDEQRKAADEAMRLQREVAAAWRELVNETGSSASGVFERLGDRVRATIDPVREFGAEVAENHAEVEKFNKAVSDLAGGAFAKLRAAAAKASEGVGKAVDTVAADALAQAEAAKATQEALLKKAANGMDTIAERVGGSLLTGGIDAFIDSINEAGFSVSALKESFADLARSVLADLQKMLLKLMAFQLVEATLGTKTGSLGGSLASALMGSFAAGGSFTVPTSGGGGGVDSTPVAFRATPGERVTITPPGGGAVNARQAAPNITLSPTIVFDPVEIMRQALRSSGGHQLVIDIVASNPSAIRAALSK